MTEKELLEKCLSEDRLAQKALYERYAAVMFGLCKRYMKTREDAEDILLGGFCRVFEKLETFKQQGSLEGWIKRIMVNEALMALRKQHNFNLTVEFKGTEVNIADEEPDDNEELTGAEIMTVLDLLPTGYRTVFNLYVLEGYKHREIAEMLGVSINTSKSQLILAKDKIKQILNSRSFPRAAGG